MNKKQIALRIQNLSVNYDKNSVLWDLSFEIPEGKLVAVIGPNGAGKSTLLKASCGLIKSISGQALFFGKKFKQVRHRISYIPQRQEVDWSFPLTVFDLVLSGACKRCGLFRPYGRKEKALAHEYLAKVNLSDLANTQIGELSGGQQQRAFLARALMHEADCYLMDEPYAGIDASSSLKISEILKELRDQGKTIIVVYHDLQGVRELFDWVVLLNRRLIGSGPVTEVLQASYIRLAYGKEIALFDEAMNIMRCNAQGNY
ncbi:putative metal transport system ATP-binding protein [Candidatus Clavichlamydia salmonicola]|uniref:metal ABC transporter ATP-binding protein n=1 Tax=Candidatus Clavichlamydia salmonicola TaxID=469812 RepID=UPI001891C8DA|nr:metal ABC transporter ATP-binding protein [Candidatus Clavichlamydia salmonicola]MBF5051039.1 putative metal transport system ATP-binding protein [Candidatus Clavichlamydia salmonicola]